MKRRDEQQTQAVVLHDFQRPAWNIGLGVARPGDSELAQLLRQRLHTRQIVGEGVIVEEEFLHLRERVFRPFHLCDDIFDRAHAITMPSHRLRPQAESAARFAAPSRVERDVGMQQIAAVIVLDGEIALVDRRHPGKSIHVLENFAVFVVNDDALAVAVGKPFDVAPGPAVGDFLDGEVEFVAGDEVHCRCGDEALLGLDCDLGSDEPDSDIRIDRLDHLGRLQVRFEGRGGGVHHHELTAAQLGGDVLEFQAVRRCIDQLRALHQSRRLREPGRVPEGAYLALHLVARAGPPVEAVVGRRMQKQRSHHEPRQETRESSRGRKYAVMLNSIARPGRSRVARDQRSSQGIGCAEPSRAIR